MSSTKRNKPLGLADLDDSDRPGASSRRKRPVRPVAPTIIDQIEDARTSVAAACKSAEDAIRVLQRLAPSEPRLTTVKRRVVELRHGLDDQADALSGLVFQR